MKCILKIVLGIYAFINLLTLGHGLDKVKSRYNNTCDDPKTRIEYVFPGFELGCWLGSVPEKDNE